MKYVFYAITIFLGLLILPISHAEEKYLTEYIDNFKYQYRKSDKVEFDKILEQEILKHIENHYLKPQPDLVKENIRVKSEYGDFIGILWLVAPPRFDDALSVRDGGEVENRQGA